MDYLLCCATSRPLSVSMTQSAFGLPRESEIERQGMLWQNMQHALTMESHSHWVHASSFSHDDTLLLTASQDCSLRIWDQAGKSLHTKTGHTGTIRSAVFSPDSQHIVSCGYDKTCKVWSIGERQAVSEMEGEFGFALTCTWGRTLLATGWEDGSLRLYDPELSKCVQSVPSAHEGWVWCMDTASQDGRLLATGSYDNKVKLWDVRERSSKAGGSKPTGILEGHKDRVYSCKFSKDGLWLATCSADNTWRLWDVRKKESVVRKRGHDDWIWDIALMPSCARAATGSRDGSIKVWDMNTGHEVSVVEEAHEGAVRCVNFSHDGKKLISGGTDEKANVWSSGEPDTTRQMEQ